ncbi:hypothetical protein JRQ81_002857, partial [Phrynocephalus forsythii]
MIHLQGLYLGTSGQRRLRPSVFPISAKQTMAPHCHFHSPEWALESLSMTKDVKCEDLYVSVYRWDPEMPQKWDTLPQGSEATLRQGVAVFLLGSLADIIILCKRLPAISPWLMLLGEK